MAQTSRPRRRKKAAGAGQDPRSASGERDAQIRAALEGWYDASARDLPWRRTHDPYAIWLSEVMLQQTRVETVIPYFERFLEAFPSVDALASAPLDEVLSRWSGLGYYRRARQLHAAAREVTERYGGALPSSASELRTLRGVGAYTAGAIASIAFDRQEPLVDGNVARVLARVEGITEDVRSAAGARLLWQAAARLVPADRPGRWNQALMELGATLCAPRAPRCPACPLAGWCAAAIEGRQDELPVVSAKKAPRVVSVVAAVLRHRGAVLLGQRRADGLFGGMWEPPMVESASLAEARGALAGFGLGPRVLGDLREIGQVTHVLTHQRLEVRVVGAEPARAWPPVAPASSAYERLSWLGEGGLGEAGPSPVTLGVGISTLAKKILAAQGR